MGGACGKRGFRAEWPRLLIAPEAKEAFMAEKPETYTMYVQFVEQTEDGLKLHIYHRQRTGSPPPPGAEVQMTVGGRTFNFVVERNKFSIDNDGNRYPPAAILRHAPRERETAHWLAMSLKTDSEHWGRTRSMP